MSARRHLRSLDSMQPGAHNHAARQQHVALLMQEILRDLAPESIASLDRRLLHRTYRSGQILYAPGEWADMVYFLEFGRVHLYCVSASGKRLALETIEPGTCFGEMPLRGEALHSAFAVAAEDLLLCTISRVEIEDLIRQWPEIGIRIIAAQDRRLSWYQARLAAFAYGSVSSRIATMLLLLSWEHRGALVPVTHGELGEMVGALRETVTKALNSFQAAGLVKLSRGQIQICDLAGLQVRAQQTNDDALGPRHGSRGPSR